MNPSCATCRFSRSQWAGMAPDMDSLRCQRYAPDRWRLVDPADWCGEYQPGPALPRSSTTPAEPTLRLIHRIDEEHFCDGTSHHVGIVIQRAGRLQPCDCLERPTNQENSPS